MFFASSWGGPQLPTSQQATNPTSNQPLQKARRTKKVIISYRGPKQRCYRLLSPVAMLLNPHERKFRRDGGTESNEHQRVAVHEDAIESSWSKQDIVVVEDAPNVRSVSLSSISGLVVDRVKWLSTETDARRVRARETAALGTYVSHELITQFYVPSLKASIGRSLFFLCDNKNYMIEYWIFSAKPWLSVGRAITAHWCIYVVSPRALILEKSYCEKQHQQQQQQRWSSCT